MPKPKLFSCNTPTPLVAICMMHVSRFPDLVPDLYCGTFAVKYDIMTTHSEEGYGGIGNLDEFALRAIRDFLNISTIVNHMETFDEPPYWVRRAIDAEREILWKKIITGTVF